MKGMLRETIIAGRTVNTSWNTLVGADREKILSAMNDWVMPNERPSICGDGHAAEKITQILDVP